MRKIAPLAFAACCLTAVGCANAVKLDYGIGLANMGQLADEQTRHFRFGGDGQVFAAKTGVAVHTRGPVWVMLKVDAAVGDVYRWSCAHTPCESLNRFSYSISGDSVFSSGAAVVTPTIGILLQNRRGSGPGLYAGFGQAVFFANSTWAGASPMGACAAEAEGRYDIPLLKGGGVYLTTAAGMIAVPRGQCLGPGFKAVDEATGQKKGGKNDPYQRSWHTLHALVGISVTVGSHGVTLARR